MRDYLGCEWIESDRLSESQAGKRQVGTSPLGWLIKAPDGSIHDPLTHVRSIRDDRSERVLEPYLKTMDPMVNLVKPDE